MQTKEVFEKGREIVVCIYIYTIDLLLQRKLYSLDANGADVSGLKMCIMLKTYIT